MNQRIKDLADHCYYDDNVRPDGTRTSEQEFIIFDKQKFAELIVKECAGVNYNSVFKDGEFHAREVLEHFGVEE